MGKLKVWYDPEGDFIEILFSDESGEFRPTTSKHVLVKVNALNQLIGFSILNASTIENEPLEADLPIEQLRRILEQHGVPLAF